MKISAVRLHIMLIFSVVAHLRREDGGTDASAAADFLDAAVASHSSTESLPVALPVVKTTAGIELVRDSAAAVARDGQTSVSCGGHSMPTCAECPLGHG